MFPSYAKKIENNKLDVEQKLLTTKSNLVVDLDKCTGCGVCIDACPEEAITEGPIGAVGRGKAKTSKIDVDAKKCSYCGVCNIMCPFDAIKLSVNGEAEAAHIRAAGFPDDGEEREDRPGEVHSLCVMRRSLSQGRHQERSGGR